jgi:ABC-2 type transport system permease protein
MNNIMLIAKREVMARLQSKGFTIPMVLMILAVVLMALAGGIIPKLMQSDGDSDTTAVAVVGQAHKALPEKGFEAHPADTREQAEQMVKSGDVDAAVVFKNESSPAEVIGLEEAPDDLVTALTVAPKTTLIDPVSKNPGVAYLVSIAFGAVFMMSAITFGTLIAQSVVEEKSSRIVEILLATVTPRELLAGKILGNCVLAVSVIVAMVGLSSVAMLVSGQELLFGEMGTALLWFAVLFIAGFVLLATLYSATAALVSRQEDVSSVTSPIMMLIMIPYILVIVYNSNPTALAVMSYIPFSAPVGMPMRLYLGIAQWWEPVLSLAIMLATVAIVLAFAARIYENSILRVGSRVKLGDAMKNA